MMTLFILSLFLVASTVCQAAEQVAPTPNAVQPSQHRLTLDTMSQSVRKMEYAVRGALVILAEQITRELESGDGSDKYPFDHCVFTNIGNPHSVGQQPLTWPRQVLALVDLPDAVGVDHPDVLKLFPADAIERAKEIKKGLGHGTGAYSHSKGVPSLRQEVAAFIERRDGGVPCDPESVFLTNGASAGIQMILQVLVASPKTGILLPIPQYPICTFPSAGATHYSAPHCLTDLCSLTSLLAFC